MLPEVECFLHVVNDISPGVVRGGADANLELGMALEQQHINSAELLDVAVLLEFLTDLGADSGDRHVQGVHGLDLGGLFVTISQCP